MMTSNAAVSILRVILLAAFALLCSSAASAEDKGVDLGVVNVSAQTGASAGLSVQSIGRKEISAEVTESAADLLGRLPSVGVVSNARGESVIELRGFDQAQLLVLIDGAPSAIPFDGVLDLGKLPSAMIERIEVIKGANSVVYGPG
ncbi:MAG TPA: TonB-dependent receptor plug domain-containing protein, partial [bacterium]|nr:TonB-dependent receptor plug domain-containing protein [bacterium]